jgi:hypothetical protein
MNAAATDRARLRAWAALAACAATLGAIVARSVLPGLPPEQDYTRGFAPPWLTAVAAVVGMATALLAIRRPAPRGAGRRVLLVIGWGTCTLLVWSAAGIVFDLFRVAALAGIPGLPPVVDWAGLACRAAALAGVATLTPAIVALQRASRKEGTPAVLRRGRLFAYAAAVLSLPYPALKVYWALGGTVGWRPTFERHPAVAETVMAIGLAALSLALAQRWGRVVPRPLLLMAGWGASAALGSMGALVAFGTIAKELGLVAGPAGFDAGNWIVYVAYGDWLFLGLALGVATWAYQARSGGRGRIQLRGSGESLPEDPEVARRYLGDAPPAP